jgi:hypothetical protein
VKRLVARLPDALVQVLLGHGSRDDEIGLQASDALHAHGEPVLGPLAVGLGRHILAVFLQRGGLLAEAQIGKNFRDEISEGNDAFGNLEGHALECKIIRRAFTGFFEVQSPSAGRASGRAKFFNKKRQQKSKTFKQ